MVNERIKYLKRGICVLLSVGVVQISFNCTILKVYAEEEFYQQVFEEYCEDNPLDGYLLIQEQQDTGIIDSKLEAQLNAQGIFDSELEEFSDEDIKSIEQADEVFAVTQYIEYKYTADTDEDNSDLIDNYKRSLDNETDVEVKGNSSTDISEDLNIIDNFMDSAAVVEHTPDGYEAKVMSDTEVDELIKEIYFDESKKEEENILNKVLVGIGIMPQNVYAATKVESSRPTATSYMKKVLMVCQVNDKVHIIFTCRWLKSPANRMIDILEISWNGGRRILNDDKHTYDANLSYDRITVRMESGYGSYSNKMTQTTEKITKDCTDNLYRNWTDKAARVPFDVPRDSPGLDIGYYYEDIRMQVSFWLKREGSGIDVYAEYNHQKKKYDFNYLMGVSLTAQTLRLVFFPAEAIGSNVLSGVGILASAGNLISISKYYETCGGMPCQVSYDYK